MGKTNINWIEMSDKAIIAAIGAYMKNQRLAINKTQAQVSQDAGVNRWTLSQIENGVAINLTSLIQILRSLDLLHVLDNFSIVAEVSSPIELAKLEQQKRRRARNKETNLEIGNLTGSEW